jgi:hypothetical protein
MDAATLAEETTRYLEAVDLVRSLELDISWRPEAEELELLTPPPRRRRPPTCVRCGIPLGRTDGPHLCLRP